MPQVIDDFFVVAVVSLFVGFVVFVLLALFLLFFIFFVFFPKRRCIFHLSVGRLRGKSCYLGEIFSYFGYVYAC